MEKIKEQIERLLPQMTRIIVSNRLDKTYQYRKVEVTWTTVRGKELCQIAAYTEKQVFQENVDVEELADKLLVCSAMICLVDLKLIPVWVVLIIIAREFIISGFRLVASDNGIVIAASYWGKFKTTFQMLMVIVIIFNINLKLSWLNILGTILIYVALVLTVVSLIDYIAKNKDVLKDQK